MTLPIQPPQHNPVEPGTHTPSEKEATGTALPMTRPKKELQLPVWKVPQTPLTREKILQERKMFFRDCILLRGIKKKPFKLFGPNVKEKGEGTGSSVAIARCIVAFGAVYTQKGW